MLIVSGFIFLLCVLALTLDGKISFSQGCAPSVEVASCLPQLVVRHARQAIRNEKQDKGSEARSCLLLIAAILRTYVPTYVMIVVVQMAIKWHYDEIQLHAATMP